MRPRAKNAAAAALNPKNYRDLIILSQSQIQMKSDHAHKMLEVYEGEWLLSVANGLGIKEIPPFTLYSPGFKDFKSRPYFERQSKAEMYLKIEAKRRENREYWSRFLALWAGVGVAFLALSFFDHKARQYVRSKGCVR